MCLSQREVSQAEHCFSLDTWCHQWFMLQSIGARCTEVYLLQWMHCSLTACGFLSQGHFGQRLALRFLVAWPSKLFLIVTLTTLSCSYWVEYSSQVIAPQTETSKWGLGFLSVHTKLPASLCLNSKQLSFSLWTDSGLISDRSLTTNQKMTWRAVFLSNGILAGCSMNHLVPWLWNDS